ncbi:hypothetical protein ACG33_04770 [Steroidobacter denitrificans]|uniref:Polysaccharide chain length determinant N-terminal domain-containing protein n=1 Tax=Steroidobacter denitrificans TaxID=465721 RepID=A0A127F7K3_STEDE|nr:hypothetical protein [Steroidobacter denitrificans]AMN46426.1 hypothetical protein ACG33_04770 [Steroidobacter denitrificans]
MTLLEFFFIVGRYRWLLLATSLTIGTLAGLYAASKEPLYGAEVTMMPAGTAEELGVTSRLGGQLGSLVSLGGFGVSVGAAKDEALAILKSRQFTEEFIDDMGLMKILYSSLWNSKEERWLAEEGTQIPTMGSAYRRFRDSIRFIKEDQKTGLVSLEIRWFDRIQAAEWANAMIQRLNERMRLRSIEQAEKSIAYLNSQLEATALVEVRQSIFGLIEKNIRQIMLARGRGEFAFKIIDPAVPAEEDNVLNVHPSLFVALGTIVGLMFGLMISFAHFFLIVDSRWKLRASNEKGLRGVAAAEKSP